MEKKSPKVLIISHNPVSTYQSMGKTFASLFTSFDKSELCQLYIYPAIPDVDMCSSFFRITDKDVMKSYYKFHVKGEEIFVNENSHNIYENAEDEKIYKNPKNKNDLRMILRDLLWKFSFWNNKKLNKWLDREKPTSIFVAPGSATFLYDIALRISKERNLPIVTYICDDFYFVKPAKTLLGKIRLSILKQKIRELMKHTTKMIAICDALEKEYSKEFSIPVVKIMTGSGFVSENKPAIVDVPTTISYFGNIRCNRASSIAHIGQVLDCINDREGTGFKIDIYTSEKDKTILENFTSIKSINLCPFVSGDEFKKKFLSSQILLHVEAFDEKSIDLVKHSVSTKIADYLACGIPVFAYAPSGISSMEHLLSNECAISATSAEELEGMLRKVFFDEKLRMDVVSKAIETAKKYHDHHRNSSLLKQVFWDMQG